MSRLREWVETQPEILAAALVGSYARDEDTAASDVDLIILAREPGTYLQDTRWADCFGTIDWQRIEKYGKVTSLRVCYSDGHEVEYGFTDETWADLPLDEGTTKVISDGIRILFERGSILSRLKILGSGAADSW